MKKSDECERTAIKAIVAIMFIFSFTVLVRSMDEEKTAYFFSISEGKSMCPEIGKLGVNIFKTTEEVEVGDVVSYESNGVYDNYKYIQHRVIEVSGDWYLIKGDNNSMFDGWIPKQWVRGKLVWHYDVKGCSNG